MSWVHWLGVLTALFLAVSWGASLIRPRCNHVWRRYARTERSEVFGLVMMGRRQCRKCGLDQSTEPSLEGQARDLGA